MLKHYKVNKITMSWERNIHESQIYSKSLINSVAVGSGIQHNYSFVHIVF